MGFFTRKAIPNSRVHSMWTSYQKYADCLSVYAKNVIPPQKKTPLFFFKFKTPSSQAWLVRWSWKNLVLLPTCVSYDKHHYDKHHSLSLQPTRTCQAKKSRRYFNNLPNSIPEIFTFGHVKCSLAGTIYNYQQTPASVEQNIDELAKSKFPMAPWEPNSETTSWKTF